MKNHHRIQVSEISYNDLIYSYKEQWFTGFAPCFQDGIYSLACCKGNKKNGGMRHSICKNVKAGRNVWVISIAGEDIQCKGHNTSGIDYKAGDVIYLAKIKKDDIYTLQKYSERFFGRRDAIYTFKSGHIERILHKEDDVHVTKEDLLTDCSACYGGWDEEKIYNDLEQIVMAEEYYVFKAGNHISDIFNVRRGYTFRKNGEKERVEALRSFIVDREFAFGFKEDPFEFCKKADKGGCHK